MIDLATSILTGTGIVASAGAIAAHTWRTRQLGARYGTFTSRLNEIETTMYTHTDPAEPTPLRAPDFTLPGLTGANIPLDRLLALGKPVLLLFSDPEGITGQSLLSSISEWQSEHDAPVTVVGIGPAGKKLSLTRSELPFGIVDVLSPPTGHAIASEYGVTLTPAVALVKPNGELVSPPTVGTNGIQSLLRTLAAAAAEANQIRQRTLEANAPAVGARAPRVLLPGYDEIDHDVVVPGAASILLFWSPDCGYCNQLLPDLRQLEASSARGTLPITIIARGTEAANRAQGLRSRTLFDHDLSASTAFGVSGTPSAVVVDGDGIVASHLARGIRSVRELLALTAPPA